MSTLQKTALGAVVLIAALGIIFYAYSTQQMRAEDESLLPTDAGDVSDSALERDAAAIDAELSALDEDSVILEESLKAHAESEVR